MALWIRIRILTKMLWIRNTAQNVYISVKHTVLLYVYLSLMFLGMKPKFAKNFNSPLRNPGNTKIQRSHLQLQMNGLWESNINVWFRLMYSQKWYCAASLFPKQNYNFLSPNFYIHVSVNDLYIPRIQDRSAYLAEADRSWEYINCSQIQWMQELGTKPRSFIAGNI